VTYLKSTREKIENGEDNCPRGNMNPDPNLVKEKNARARGGGEEHDKQVRSTDLG